MSKDIRTLFVGMPGQFSHIVLERLLAHSINVVAVLLSGPKNVQHRAVVPPDGNTLLHPEGKLELTLLNPTISLAPATTVVGRRIKGSVTGASASNAHQVLASPLVLAVSEGIPVFECGRIGRLQTTEWLSQLAPDVAIVACWNGVIPPHVLEIPRYGFLNVHPSLLPSYRGPYPLFWQFRNGETATGVSVHWMDADLDTGDIAGQRQVRFEDGLRGVEAEALCARSGGDLLAIVLGRLSRGTVVRRPQPSGGSYFPAPSPIDFTLEAGWHPRRAFNFMRATAEWGIPFSLESKGTVFRLIDAIKWQAEASPEPTGKGTVWALFQGGSVLAEEWSQKAP